jgi:hypothetical protein
MKYVAENLYKEAKNMDKENIISKMIANIG